MSSKARRLFVAFPRPKASSNATTTIPHRAGYATGGSREIDPGIADPTAMQKPYAESSTSTAASGKPSRPYNYPLYPSVQQLLHANGHTDADAAKIPATGPNGRLLKGDVLAFLGQINKDYPSDLSQRLNKLTHLDLTYTAAAPPPPPAQPAQQNELSASLPTATEIAVPISLAAVIATQKRVQDSLDIFLPLSTFIARASELANESLPARRGVPTADDLFNSVLGLDKVTLPKQSRGHFFPHISGVSPMPAPTSKKRAGKADIIDMLAAPKSGRDVGRGEVAAALGISAGDNVFSVSAGNGEEERATEYLERLKMALETEPGRLVL